MELPWHTRVLPVILPGISCNPPFEMFSVAAVDDPQELFALTLIVPPPAPAVADILVEVELPDHPAGRTQL